MSVLFSWKKKKEHLELCLGEPMFWYLLEAPWSCGYLLEVEVLLIRAFNIYFCGEVRKASVHLLFDWKKALKNKLWFNILQSLRSIAYAMAITYINAILYVRAITFVRVIAYVSAITYIRAIFVRAMVYERAIAYVSAITIGLQNLCILIAPN